MDEHWYLSKLYSTLAKRPKTVFEVKQWLTRQKAPEMLQESVIEKLCEMKLLDDIEYTHAFVRTQKLIKPLSSRAVMFKLQKKGIPSQIVKNVLEEEGHDEIKAAKEEVRRASWRWVNLTPAERKQKIAMFLSRKGFSFEVIRKIDAGNGQE